ncbi:hypothetical protein BDW72DRAFT_187776 [Aspergillus terricola var. indicus]
MTSMLEDRCPRLEEHAGFLRAAPFIFVTCPSALAFCIHTISLHIPRRPWAVPRVQIPVSVVEVNILFDWEPTPSGLTTYVTLPHGRSTASLNLISCRSFFGFFSPVPMLERADTARIPV